MAHATPLYTEGSISQDLATMDSRDFLKFRTNVFGKLRRASDRVRLDLIPDALDAGLDCKTALARFNRAYFEGGVLTGQMAGDADRINYENRAADTEFYDTRIEDLGGLRKTRIQAAGLELVHPAFLPALADQYFERISRERALDDEAFFRFPQRCIA